MRAFLVLAAALAGLVGVAMLVSPSGPGGVVRRITAYVRLVPPVEAAPSVPEPPAGARPGSAATPAEPSWRAAEREAARLFEAARFHEAAEAYRRVAAMKGLSSREAAAFRAQADRILVHALLDAAVPREAPGGPAEEAEYLRRARAAKDAASLLATARFAAARGLRSHLPWLYERAHALRDDGTDAYREAVAAAYRAARERNSAGPGREVAAAVLREVPAGEAAEMAREDTGGIGGAEVREDTADAERDRMLEEARTLKREGDREYRLAVPGSDGVNLHRRKALDAYVRSREIYEEVARRTGRTTHDDVIHDLNRNIAELKKDLPVGK